MGENTSIETRTEESINGQSSISLMLVISIICTAIGLGIISLLIIMIPDYPFSYEGYLANPDTIYDTFFYNIRYYTYTWSNTYYFRLGPGTGYYILMPIAVCLIVISSSTILINNNREKVILIIANFALSISTIVIGMVFYYLNDARYYRNIEQPLGFFPLYLSIYLYVALLIDRTTFLEWSGIKASGLAKKVLRALNEAAKAAGDDPSKWWVSVEAIDLQSVSWEMS